MLVTRIHAFEANAHALVFSNILSVAAFVVPGPKMNRLADNFVRESSNKAILMGTHG